MNELDSLEAVELALLIEGELKGKDIDELDKAVFSRIACPPERWHRNSPDPADSASKDVLVIGRVDSKVLFILSNLHSFGVGWEESQGVIGQNRMFSTLKRALFEFR